MVHARPDPTATAMSSDEIDALLEQYLTLLDQYTSLRKELATLQSSIHQEIARANFSAERGTRYGQTHYDDRMRATKRIEISPSSNHTAKNVNPVPKFTAMAYSTTTDSRPLNPLRMFGLLIPPPLKHAQASAIEMVQEIIPQLVTLDAALREQEICIRRARKRFGKAGGKAEVVVVGGGEE